MKKRLFLLPVLVIGAASMAGCGKTMSPQEKIDAAIDQALEVPSDIFAVSPVLANAITSDAKDSLANLVQTVSDVSVIIEDMSMMYPDGYRDLRKVKTLHQELTTSVYENACETIDTNGYVNITEGAYSTYVNYTRNDTIFADKSKGGTYDVYDNIKFDYEGRSGEDLVKQIALDGYYNPLDSEEIMYNFTDLSLAEAQQTIRNYFTMSESLKLGANGDASDIDYLFMDSKKENAYIVRSIAGDSYAIPSPIDFSKEIIVTETEKYVIHFAYVNNTWRVDSYAYSSTYESDSDFTGRRLATPAIVEGEKFVTHAVYGEKSTFKDYDRYHVDDEVIVDRIKLNAYLPGKMTPIEEDGIFDFYYPEFYDETLYNKVLNPSSSDFVFTVGTNYNYNSFKPGQILDDDISKTIDVYAYDADDPLVWLYAIYEDEFVRMAMGDTKNNAGAAERKDDFSIDDISSSLDFGGTSSNLFLPKNFDFSFNVKNALTQTYENIGFKQYDGGDPFKLVEEGNKATNAFRVKESGFYSVTISYGTNRDYEHAILSIKFISLATDEDAPIYQYRYNNFKITSDDASASRWDAVWYETSNWTEETITQGENTALPADQYGSFNFILRTKDGGTTDYFVPTKAHYGDISAFYALDSGIEFIGFDDPDFVEKPDAYYHARTIPVMDTPDGAYQTDIAIYPYYYDEYNDTTVYIENKNIGFNFKDAPLINKGEIIGVDTTRKGDDPMSGYHIDYPDGTDKTFNSNLDYKYTSGVLFDIDNRFVIYKDGERCTSDTLPSDDEIFVSFVPMMEAQISFITEYVPLSYIKQELDTDYKNFIVCDDEGCLTYNKANALDVCKAWFDDSTIKNFQISIGVGGEPEKSLRPAF